ncbi:MAG: hypothetical protein AB9846_03690 [Tenuifilaceae bacterium]
MKRILLIISVLLFNSLSVISMDSISIQDTTKGTDSSKSFPKSKLGIDIMVLMTGEKKEVEIRKFSLKYIYFSSPSETTMKQIDRRLVNTIYYRSGKKEVITPKATDIPDNTDWEKIVITEDPKDIGTLMIQIDIVEAKVEANNREQYNKPETLERSAYNILRKRAALIKGEIVLIKKKSHSRAYGEPPSLVVQGIAYRKR